jgi:tetratricopeptide (TPR) repeat protein
MSPSDEPSSEHSSRRRSDGGPPGKRPRDKKGSGGDKITVVRREAAGSVAWEIVQPRCARRRQEDIEEVEAMIEAGEPEIAREELVWLLSECPDFLEAHVQLGLIALEDGDAKLARGHFGRAYELCLRAIEAAGNPPPKPLPHALPGNHPFFEAAKGLVHCLLETGRKKTAVDICRRIAPLDPVDPLGIQKLVSR